MIVAEIRQSKAGNKYACIYADLDYTKVTLTMDRRDIAEVLGISVTELMTSPVGTKWEL